MKETSLPFSQSAQLIACIAEALHYAHGEGLVHRDVKPGNILLDSGGRPYLVDFGVALKAEDCGDGQLTGTPAYMSPEQMRGDGKRVDGRSDVFSLGVVFYELLTGRRPFPGKSYAELLEQITEIEVKPPRQLDGAIPKELERICLKALEKKAAERYSTAKDFADDLRLPPPHPCQVACLKGHESWIWSVAFLPDGDSILSGSYDKTMRLWSVKQNKQLYQFCWHKGSVTDVDSSHDGLRVLSASADHSVTLWDLPCRKVIHQFQGCRGHTGSVYCVDFSPNGKYAVSGSSDYTVRIWDLSTFETIAQLYGHHCRVRDVAFSPDGTKILTAGGANLLLWDVASRKVIHSFPEHEDEVHSISFSADGRLAASAGSDCILHVWDTKSAKVKMRLGGHSDTIASVAFLPNGRHLLSGSHDQTVRLWDIQLRKQVCCFDGHEDFVISVACSPDGRKAVSAGKDKTIRVWKLP